MDVQRIGRAELFVSALKSIINKSYNIGMVRSVSELRIEGICAQPLLVNHLTNEISKATLFVIR